MRYNLKPNKMVVVKGPGKNHNLNPKKMVLWPENTEILNSKPYMLLLKLMFNFIYSIILSNNGKRRVSVTDLFPHSVRLFPHLHTPLSVRHNCSMVHILIQWLNLSLRSSSNAQDKFSRDFMRLQQQSILGIQSFYLQTPCTTYFVY